MYTNENKAVELAKFLLDFDYVIIDTCSLMESSFPVWMDRLVLAREYLSGTKCNIYVHQESIGELQKLARDKREFDRYASTKRALKIIRHAKWQKLLKILKKQKKSEKNFADNAIYVKVSLDRLNQKILVITQDKKLASDLISLNRLMSQKGRPVQVYRFAKDTGELVINRGETTFSEKPKTESTASSENGKSAQKKGGTGKDPVKMPKLAEVVPEKKPDVAATPTPSATEPDSPVVKTNNKLYFTSNSLDAAIQGAASLVDIMFRYPTIPYQAQFHGPLDVTSDDLERILENCSAQLKEKIVVSFRYRDMTILVETLSKGYRASVSITPKTSPVKPKAVPNPPKEPEVIPAKEAKDAPAGPDEEALYQQIREDFLGIKDIYYVTYSYLRNRYSIGMNRATKVMNRFKEENIIESQNSGPKGFRIVGRSEPSAEKAKKTPGPAPEILTEEGYQHIKEEIFKRNIPYVTKPYIQKEFGLGSVRAAKVMTRFHQDGVIADKPTDSSGFLVLRPVEEKPVKESPAQVKPAKGKAAKKEPVSDKPTEEVAKPASTNKNGVRAKKKAEPSKPDATNSKSDKPKTQKKVGTKPSSSPKKENGPKAQPAQSPALSAAFQGEAKLQALLDDPNATKEQINTAIERQVALYGALTPTEKRKVTLNKTALGKLRRK
ncbi:MAG: hypothetical protein SPG64_00980 [Candidatus Enteromonas sp.]|nr:hypothetical protein [Candidatus Enteromonas sp.]